MSYASWPILKNLKLCKYSIYLDKNKISNKGCKYLSQANWPRLQAL